MVLQRIIENQKTIEQELKQGKNRIFFSPSGYWGKKLTEPTIIKYSYGKLLDVGSGTMPYKDSVLNKTKVSEYHTMDIKRSATGVTFVGDIQNMYMINDKTYDSLLCLQVLEHIKDPFKAVYELHRICKVGGILILSAPHLSRLHDEPHDYYRYTKYGFKSMLEGAGFEILNITPMGGLFSFLGHQVSHILIGLVWHIPIIKHIAFFINKWCCVKLCYFLDTHIDSDKLFALNYIVVAKRV